MQTTTRLAVPLLFIMLSVTLHAAPIATITTIEGTASVLPAKGEKWRKARPNMPLKVGDQVYSREKSFVEVRYTSGAVLRMNENSKVVLKSASDKAVKSENPLGNVWVNMQKIASKKSFELSSPTAVAAIRGTVFQMQTARDSSTSVRVYDGTVDVGPSTKLKQKLEQKKKAPTPPDGPGEVRGPEEVPGPEEVTLEVWRAIVAGQMISVGSDGSYAEKKFDMDAAAEDTFVKKNQELDKQLLQEGSNEKPEGDTPAKDEEKTPEKK